MGLRGQVEGVRQNAGIWRRSDHAVIQVSGRDAGTWLQAQTTNDVLALASGEGCMNAFLDRTGRVQAFFSTHRWEDQFWLVVESAQVAAVLQRAETHLVMEEAALAVLPGSDAQVVVEGPRSRIPLSAWCGGAAIALPEKQFSFAPLAVLGSQVLAFRMSESGEDGFVLMADAAEVDGLYAALVDGAAMWGVTTVSEAARDCLRVENATLRYGADVGPGEIINETPLCEHAVSATKGCYPGQEVVTRLANQGSPKKALAALVMEDGAGTFPDSGSVLQRDGRKVGRMCSSTYSPTLDRWVALAYMDRACREHGAVLTLSGGGETFTAELRHLPVYTPRTPEQHAEELYAEALRLFEQDAEDEDETPVVLLREALLLAPGYEDALEVLGVLLHRRGRTDEAIEHMRALANLDPASVMAHANLSQFYLAQGKIAEAETEKAKARELELARDMNAARAARQAEAERARVRQETIDRMAMFREVLEIDPKDPLATMGLGSGHMQLEEYAEAIPYLRAAVGAKPDYSAAFLNLGKCLAFTGNDEEARKVFREGIVAAGRQGDFAPLREMEQRLAALSGKGAA